MAGNLHGHLLGDSSPNHVPHCGPSEIVKNQPPHPSQRDSPLVRCSELPEFELTPNAQGAQSYAEGRKAAGLERHQPRATGLLVWHDDGVNVVGHEAVSA